MQRVYEKSKSSQALSAMKTICLTVKSSSQSFCFWKLKTSVRAAFSGAIRRIV